MSFQREHQRLMRWQSTTGCAHKESEEQPLKVSLQTVERKFASTIDTRVPIGKVGLSFPTSLSILFHLLAFLSLLSYFFSSLSIHLLFLPYLYLNTLHQVSVYSQETRPRHNALLHSNSPHRSHIAGPPCLLHPHLHQHQQLCHSSTDPPRTPRN